MTKKLPVKHRCHHRKVRAWGMAGEMAQSVMSLPPMHEDWASDPLHIYMTAFTYSP